MSSQKRNITPSKISLVASLILGVVFCIALLVAKTSYIYIFLITPLLILVSFFIIRIILNVFIYDKVKLIYNAIHQIKTNNQLLGKDIVSLNENPLDAMEKEVEQWEKTHLIELKESEQKEIYRKEFLGNVSHELKTPITNIQGYIHTLLDGALYDSQVNEKFLLKASKSADRMQYLVEELLSISKFEQGNLMLKPIRFNITELIENVIEAQEEKAKKLKISVNLLFDTNKPVFVEGDNNYIRQVFTNLLVNGMYYNHEGGHVNIGIQIIENRALILVEDNGVGIAQADMPRLFERFYRVDQSRSRTHGGTGLGLAIVKHIIDAHDQTISVNSEVGKGSTFSFTLNLAKKESK